MVYLPELFLTVELFLYLRGVGLGVRLLGAPDPIVVTKRSDRASPSIGYRVAAKEIRQITKGRSNTWQIQP
jgi:hypothetical protein